MFRTIAWLFSSYLCVSLGSELAWSAEAAEAPPVITRTSDQAVDLRLQVLADWARLVLERHPEVMLAESESRQAALRLREADAARWPQSTLIGNVGWESQQISASASRTDYQPRQLQVRVSVALRDKGLDAQIQQREAKANAGEWALAEVHDQLVLRTVELYAEVVRSEQMTELARKNLKLHRAYVAQMKDIARIDLGRTSDLPMAQSRVALAESVLLSRLARLDAARVQWIMLTGKPAPGPNTAPEGGGLEGLPVVALPPSVDVAVADAMESSLSLRKSLADIAAAKGALAGANAVYSPKIVAEVRSGLGRDYAGIPGNQSNHYVGLGLEWMLPFNPGLKYADQAAQEGVLSATHARDSLTLKIRASVEAQWYELLAAQASVATFSDYVLSAEKVVQAYGEQFKIGRRSLLDVLNAENELFTARSNVAAVQNDVAVASWRLLGLRGLLRQELGL